MLDDITLCWLTNSAYSSARLYWENNNKNFSAEAQRTAAGSASPRQSELQPLNVG
jgi:hypothetical protein